MTRAFSFIALTALAVSAAISGAPSYAGAAAASSPHGKVIVVATDGSDSNSGTAAAPLRTIQVAVQRLPRGGTVELRAGHYHQRVRLAGVRHLTLRPYRHEKAVLDGAGLTPPTEPPR